MKIGILGGGQLGRMLALAGHRLGMTFRFFEPADDPPVATLGDVVQADYSDVDALARFAEGLDCATYEFENVPVDTVRTLAKYVSVRPSSSALELAQDRLIEKQGFGRLGVPTTPYRQVQDEAGLARAANELGFPFVLKTRRFGYDGKGQAVVRGSDELERAWAAVRGAASVAEAFVPFDRELSQVAVRSYAGDMTFYPLVQNQHKDGILSRTIAPADNTAGEVTDAARSAVRSIAEETDYAGVLAVEFFEIDGQLLANEMAPRVHNSGHWTQDGAVTCQFENHLRAITGLPLGSTALNGTRTVMTNLIGTMPSRTDLLSDPGAHVHLYDKEPRPGRKIGHVNVVELGTHRHPVTGD